MNRLTCNSLQQPTLRKLRVGGAVLPVKNAGGDAPRWARVKVGAAAMAQVAPTGYLAVIEPFELPRALMSQLTELLRGIQAVIQTA
jgi:hypothetical protein